MLEMRNVCSGYGGKEVLHSVSLTAWPGQFTAVVGPNGCGKSTLLKTVCGILPCKSGEININGEKTEAMDRQMLAKAVAYLPQGRAAADITVGRLVLHGRFPYLQYPRRYRREDYAAARRAMEQLGLTELADMPLEKLSGGQRQKAYIAMALAQDTPWVLLDEPTTYLDICHQLQTMNCARMLCGEGKGVVTVLHDLPMALENADQVAVMDRGRVVLQDTPEAALRSGVLEEVFGVRVLRVEMTHGTRYLCEKLPDGR